MENTDWGTYANNSKAGKKRAVHIVDDRKLYVYWPIEDNEIADLVCWFEGIDWVPLVETGDRRFESAEECPLCGITTRDFVAPALEWCGRCDESDPA